MQFEKVFSRSGNVLENDKRLTSRAGTREVKTGKVFLLPGNPLSYHLRKSDGDGCEEKRDGDFLFSRAKLKQVGTDSLESPLQCRQVKF